MKSWQCHVTLLKIQEGDVLTTINTLMNSFHLPSTHIAVHVIYNTTQNDLRPRKHNYLIYYIRKFLQILKSGYPALNIVINSRPLSCALKLCVTPFSSKSLTSYGLTIIMLENSIDTMNNTTNGYINTLWISILVLGHATNITRTKQHVSPS